MASSVDSHSGSRPSSMPTVGIRGREAYVTLRASPLSEPCRGSPVVPPLVGGVVPREAGGGVESVHVVQRTSLPSQPFLDPAGESGAELRAFFVEAPPHQSEDGER